ncbi:type II secretion system GspH family protein [Halobacillus litoralis]|uniref:type II secretion system protein n=1 Tax=Halobacillus litoralis TaxID=45668 RepID=UPI001CD47304|nr:type II secretion system protein [Halobacillus litoralis]MCA0969920.1 type II secretion system GspH family protein [Halobacillus litoralis]
MFQNEKGITLVEILVSIALISIVITLFLSLFGDYMLMTKRVENEVDGINLAEEVAYYIEVSDLQAESCEGGNIELDLTSSLENYEPFGLDDSNQLYYSSPQNQTYYPVVRQLCEGIKDEESDSDLVPIEVIIQRKLESGEIVNVTETFRYLKSG